MRLTCPNCGAQYEVDDDVIPPGGRDVQCSACGRTWLQLSAAELSAADQADAPHARAAAPEPAHDTPPAADGDEWPSDLPPPPVAPPEAGSRRRRLDDSVLNVLREEADRESRQRKAEGSSLEIQDDLGLPPPPPAPEAAVPAVVAAVAADEDAEVVSRAARRDLLPDIEEINSTLRATSERGGEAAAFDAPQTLRERRNSFRKGFLSSLGLMVLLLLPYIFATNLAGSVPALAPALERYSNGIDTLRVWLDTKMKSTTESMQTPPPAGNG